MTSVGKGDSDQPAYNGRRSITNTWHYIIVTSPE